MAQLASSLIERRDRQVHLEGGVGVRRAGTEEHAAQPALAQPQAVQDLFQSLTILTSISWSLYPVVVFLGRAECQVITKEMEEFLLVVLDIISKMGVEALIITHVVSQHGSDSTSSSSSGSA